MNVSHLIRRHVQSNPEKTAVVFGDRRISYGALEDAVNRTARGLLGWECGGGRSSRCFSRAYPS